MKVLVDFDNLGLPLSQRGMVYLVDLILDRIPADVLSSEKRCEFRLYAGWDRNRSLTTAAQKLSAELLQLFPRILKKPDPITVTVELAQALEILPRHKLSNTYRIEPLSRGIHFQQPTTVACRNDQCPIEVLFPFFRDQKCPHAPCGTRPEVLASQHMQKLVDTMLVADLIHLAGKNMGNLCVVSSDDDIWPGILTVLALGKQVIHLQPRRNGQSEKLYLPPTQSLYIGVGL